MQTDSKDTKEMQEKCPPDCDCERFPIYGVVKLEGDKVPKLQRIVTGVMCKR